MDPADSVLAVGLLTLAAFVAGLFGFGFGIVAMAGLTLTMDVVRAAGIVNLASLFVTGSLAWRLRAHAQRDVVRRIAPWLLVGVALGVFALSGLDGALLARALGALIVAVALWNLSGRVLRVSDGRAASATIGLAAGLLGGAFNTGGPPLIAYVYSRPGRPEALKATLQVLFLCSTATRLPIAVSQGLIDMQLVWSALLAVPFAALGEHAGMALSMRLPGHAFRKLAWLGLGALGVVLLLGK